jgi:hypothetical protein
MLWKRNIEQIAATVPTFPPAPWSVKIDDFDQHIIVGADGTPVITTRRPGNDAKAQEMWMILTTLCLIRNNCEMWFEEMLKAGISDIVLPKKKQPSAPKKPYVAPEACKFKVSEEGKITDVEILL